MKHEVYVEDVHVSSYANLVLLQRLYTQLENNHWQEQRSKFLYKTLREAGKLQCRYCQRDNLKIKSHNKHEQATVDHVVQKFLGGDEFSQENFAVCCRNCNQAKATQSELEFMASSYIKNKKLWSKK